MDNFAMDTAPQPTSTHLPEPGAPLPAFTASSTSGQPLRVKAYKQRQPVLLVAFHGAACRACRAWLAALTDERARLDELGVAVLAVAPAPLADLRALQSALDLPFPLLADEDGRVARAYLPAAAPGARPAVALYAADRYNYVLARWCAPEADTLPTPDEALTPIVTAEQEDCGCGLPAWPEEALR